MIKMLALDLDGTLALPIDHQVSEATRTALAALHADGVEVVIATGRRYRTSRFVIENLGFDTYTVCNGGALVKTPDQKTFYSDTFCIADCAMLARELNLTLFAQRDAHELGGPDFILDDKPVWNQQVQAHFKLNREWSGVGDLTDGEDRYLVAGCFGHEPELNELAAAIHEAHPDQYFTTVVSHLQTGFYYCEIAQRHINKWFGLEKLQVHLDLAADNVCAVGDDLNDLPMIRAAGHSAAMENGHAEVHEQATFVCGHNEADGIVDVVSYIREFNR